MFPSSLGISQPCLVTVFLTSVSVDFQKSPSSDFIWRETSPDFVARGRPLRGQTRLAPLAKKSTCSKSSVIATVVSVAKSILPVAASCSSHVRFGTVKIRRTLKTFFGHRRAICY